MATRATGCVDAIVNHKTGLLIDIDDEASAVEALETLLADTTLREKMGRAARERVEALFSQDRLLTNMFSCIGHRSAWNATWIGGIDFAHATSEFS